MNQNPIRCLASKMAPCLMAFTLLSCGWSSKDDAKIKGLQTALFTVGNKLNDYATNNSGDFPESLGECEQSGIITLDQWTELERMDAVYAGGRSNTDPSDTPLLTITPIKGGKKLTLHVGGHVTIGAR